MCTALPRRDEKICTVRRTAPPPTFPGFSHNINYFYGINCLPSRSSPSALIPKSPHRTLLWYSRNSRPPKKLFHPFPSSRKQRVRGSCGEAWRFWRSRRRSNVLYVICGNLNYPSPHSPSLWEEGYISASRGEGVAVIGSVGSCTVLCLCVNYPIVYMSLITPYVVARLITPYFRDFLASMFWMGWLELGGLYHLFIPLSIREGPASLASSPSFLSIPSLQFSHAIFNVAGERRRGDQDGEGGLCHVHVTGAWCRVDSRSGWRRWVL